MTEESPIYKLEPGNSLPSKKKFYCVIATEDGVCILVEAPATLNTIKAAAQQYGIANRNLQILIPLNPGG